MFVFGVHIESQEVFDRHCLPGIAANGGRDATLITTSDLPKVRACNDMLDAAVGMENVDAIVMLHETSRITDPMFTAKVTRALSDSPGLDVFGPASDDDPTAPDPTCLIIRASASETLRFDAEKFDSTASPAGFEEDLVRRAAAMGLAVGTVDISVTPLAPPPARPAELSGTERFESTAVEWQGRAAHRITRTLLERWREATPAAELAPQDRAPRPDAGPAVTRVPLADQPLPDRVELITHVPDAARRVLDVAAGAGMRGAAIKQRTGAHVVGIEPREALADAARTRLDEVWEVDLNALASPDATRATTTRRSRSSRATSGNGELPESEPFDVILMPDTLERLLDPETTVRLLAERLTDDGVLVATVPNVKHWSVLLPLLIDDRFEYSATGPIRPSSLRFYTMIEAAALLRRSGLDWCEATAATTVSLADPEQLDPLLDAVTAYGVDTDEARTLFNAYEFVLTARKKAPKPEPPEYGGDPAGE